MNKSVTGKTLQFFKIKKDNSQLGCYFETLKFLDSQFLKASKGEIGSVEGLEATLASLVGGFVFSPPRPRHTTQHLVLNGVFSIQYLFHASLLFWKGVVETG